MIGGFEAPTSGLIELQGQDVTWLPPYKRNVNTVFQNYALFPHLTIYENVAFGLRRKGVKDAEVKSRVTDMLALVELPGFETPQADPDLGRPGAARRAGPGPDQQARRPPPRRAARSARPQAAQADAGRAQADPAGGRDHVHLRDPRPGRGDDDVGSHRRHEQGPLRAARRARGPVRAPDDALRGRLPRASATCCPAPSRATTARTRRSASPTTRASAPRARWSATRPTSSVGVRPEKIRLHEADVEAPAGHNHMSGVVRDASYLGVSTQYLIEARWRCPDHGLRAERRARHQGRAVGARRGRPADVVPRPHLRRRRRRRCPSRRHRADPSPNRAPDRSRGDPMTEKQAPHRRRPVAPAVRAGQRHGRFRGLPRRLRDERAPRPRRRPPRARPRRRRRAPRSPRARRRRRPRSRRRRPSSTGPTGPTTSTSTTNDQTKFKTLEDFKAKYGTTVNYVGDASTTTTCSSGRSSRSSRPARTPAGT